MPVRVHILKVITTEYRGTADAPALSVIERDGLRTLKIKAQLSLSFAYKEMK